MAPKTRKAEGVTLIPATVVTVGTMSGQDLAFTTNTAPEKLARDLLAATRPLVLTTTDGREVWLRPEHIETITYPAVQG